MGDQKNLAQALGFVIAVLDVVSTISALFTATSPGAVFGAVVGLVARLLTVLLVVRHVS